jgi:formylglycine-generating enzyme required for sulfatase activity
MKRSITRVMTLSTVTALCIGLLIETSFAKAALTIRSLQPTRLVDKQSPPQTDRLQRAGDKAPAETITNSKGMQLRLIKPGSFMMGSTEGDSDEMPIHKVTLTKAFYMGIHEVTQAQYEKVMGTNPSHFQGANRPVEQISWNDAQAFCQKLSAQENRSYRLPTEAEWEYACRAGSSAAYYWGKRFYTRYAWSRQNSEDTTHDVGMRLPNAWRLFDMSGNVWEWCQDRKGQYDPSAPDETDPEGPPKGIARVLRGGSWYGVAENCRSASRDKNAPNNRHNSFGFRVVLDVNEGIDE